MGTGWKRAFCTAIPRDKESSTTSIAANDHKQNPPTPSRRCVSLNFFSGTTSNPSTPRLRCRTTTTTTSSSSIQQTPDGDIINPINSGLQCRTATMAPKSSIKSILGYNTSISSPRSPFSIFKNSLIRFSRNNCGVCMQSVKSGQGMAIYTAECSHAFHFPCIADHVKKNDTLVCPVCKSAWKDVPLLAIHKIKNKQSSSSPTKIEHQQIHNVKKNLNSGAPAYNDDEPLVSPMTGTTRFVSIPEIEIEEDDAEEFKGFFVNPISSSSDEPAFIFRDMRNVEISLMPESAVVSTGRTHETHAVVLKIKAPSLPPANLLDGNRRAPIDLVVVLDVSGSMIGTKLQMMKRAMRLVISSLSSSDRLSIVAFSASSKRLLQLRRMTVQGQRAARHIIDRLGCSQGSSVVGEALKKAGKVLEDRRVRNPVASIMLLSDGQDDNSVNSTDQDQRQCAGAGGTHVSSTRFSHVEIPVQAFKQKKTGNYIHEPAEDAFTKCVGGLLSVVVQDIRLQLSLASGSDAAEVAAVYSCDGKPVVLGSSSIKLGDLYAEEERELLVELRVPTPAVGSHHVLSVRCSYRDPATQQETINGGDHTLVVPRAQVIRPPSTPLKLERLRNLFITTRAIAESRRLIENNELNSAYQLLSSAQALIIRSGSVSAEEYISGLEAELCEVQWRREQISSRLTEEEREMLTPTSGWRAAERLAKVALMKKSLNRRVSDLHGFENARF